MSRTERGKNRYGLDMSYFRNLINREMNRTLVDYKPDELARVFARAALAADKSILAEPEFARYAGGGEAVIDSFVVYAKRQSNQPYLGELARAYKECLKAGVIAHPAPSVPEEKPLNDATGQDPDHWWAIGWNDCRKAMLASSKEIVNG